MLQYKTEHVEETTKRYVSPTIDVIAMSTDAVRTSGGEVGVSWNSQWNESWNNWEN